ncbi:MAG: hypothetical protein ACRCZB_02910 [Bacteroidales bacterium]
MKNKVTKEDLQGEIKDFPIEVVHRMCECQVEQGNEFCPYSFKGTASLGVLDGGFCWLDTSEGQDFWEEIINDKNFELFFAKYPRQEQKQEINIKAESNVPENHKVMYNPFTFEDREILRNKWVCFHDLTDNGMITGITETWVQIFGESISYDELLSNYVFLDGSPCGKLKK